MKAFRYVVYADGRPLITKDDRVEATNWSAAAQRAVMKAKRLKHFRRTTRDVTIKLTKLATPTAAAVEADE